MFGFQEEKEKKNERREQYNYSTSSKADLWNSVQSHVQGNSIAKKAAVDHINFPSTGQIL